MVPFRPPRGLDGTMAQRNDQHNNESSEEDNVSYVRFLFCECLFSFSSKFSFFLYSRCCHRI